MLLFRFFKVVFWVKQRPNFVYLLPKLVILLSEHDLSLLLRIYCVLFHRELQALQVHLFCELELDFKLGLFFESHLEVEELESPRHDIVQELIGAKAEPLI